MMAAPIQPNDAHSAVLARFAADQAHSPVRPIKPILILILAGTVLAALLLAVDIATDGNDALFDLLTAIDLAGLAVVVLTGLRRLRHDPATPSALAAEADDLDGLVRAKQAAENANLAKSRYLASVSHEIRSPLNAIYGYAQLFERGDGANAQEAARVILRSAEHLTHLVEGLLDISQLESGVLRVRTEEVPFAPFMDQIVSMMRPSALSKGLEFRYEQPARMPDVVRLDAGRFRQVLINLLSNAIKFTEHGSVTLSLRYVGQIATFEVRDTGPGIPAEDHERIFERFERAGAAGPRAQPSDGKVKPGAGLGLAIARTIVEILGGSLELESDVGVGTCFRITMMLNEVAGRIVTPAPTRKLTGHEGRQRHVLLAEDDPDQRRFMQRLLTSLGFHVRVADSGEAALESLDGASLDLAILDISMPGISGWETGLRLRERFGDTLQILMLSANSEELHRPDFDTPAHDRFLVKPVEFEHLADTLGDMLGLVWQWDEPAPPPSPAVQTGAALSEAAKPHLARLQEYLRIGYIRGIEAEIRALEDEAPDAEPLVRRLYDHLDRYDLAGMARLLGDRTE